MRRYVLAIASSAVLACVLVGISLILPACKGGGLPDPGITPDGGASAWGMAGGGALRQGLSAYAGPDTPQIAWKYVVDSRICGRPVYTADGKLCISERRVALAFDESGEVTWRYSGEKNVLHMPSVA